MTQNRFYIAEKSTTPKRTMFRTWMIDEAGNRIDLCEGAGYPVCDTARELVKLGFSGAWSMRWEGADHDAVILDDIANAARFSISEGNRNGLSVYKWAPRDFKHELGVPLARDTAA